MWILGLEASHITELVGLDVKPYDNYYSKNRERGRELPGWDV